MKLAVMRSELQARGFDYVTDSRLNSFLNRAYVDLSDEEDWPFLEVTTSGTAPLRVASTSAAAGGSALRAIESVIDTTTQTKLRPLDRRHITDYDYTLSTAGTPAFYYTTTDTAIETVSGNVAQTTTVNVYPTSTTDTISVRYWQAPQEMDSDIDEPLVPSRFQQVIIDGACVYAYMDSDNIEAAREWAALFEAGKARMRESLLRQQHDMPDDFIVISAGSEDW